MKIQHIHPRVRALEPPVSAWQIYQILIRNIKIQDYLMRREKVNRENRVSPIRRNYRPMTSYNWRGESQGVKEAERTYLERLRIKGIDIAV
ncbi:MAG: hypothetical protein U9Q06_02990 [Nanoarchaeota archaeon]|nr:hypothetical protein [Nanoarchaeota archaeon]